MSRAEQAPLFVDCLALSEWLLARLDRAESCSRVLGPRLCQRALDLLEHVLLALKNIEREHHIDAADACLIVLRCELRLAGSLEYLTQEQMLYALELASRIGRQLGGWQNSLDAA